MTSPRVNTATYLSSNVPIVSAERTWGVTEYLTGILFEGRRDSKITKNLINESVLILKVSSISPFLPSAGKITQ